MAEESKLAEKLQEKQSEQKFSEEELKKVNSLRDTYNQIQFRLGQTKVSLIRTNQQLEDLEKYENDLSEQFVKTQEEEKTFLEEITKKYGQGELDIESGVFYPQNPE